MRRKHLVILVLLTSVSLIMASLISREQVEEVRADDYGTYLHRPSTTHAVAWIHLVTGQLPVLVSHQHGASPDISFRDAGERAPGPYTFETVPIYLSYRQILI